MMSTNAAAVEAGDTLHRVAAERPWVRDRAYDALVLDVQREDHNGVTFAVFVLEPVAPARSSVVRTPLDRGVTVTKAEA